MKKRIGSGMLFFVFLMMIAVPLCSACAEDFTPDFLMTGERKAPVSMIIWK